MGQYGWEYYTGSKYKKFDVAFLLKLIPVIARRDKKLFYTLADIPAKILIITGSKQALVRGTDIRNRENKALMKFIKITRGKVIGKINIGNEFGYVVTV